MLDDGKPPIQHYHVGEGNEFTGSMERYGHLVASGAVEVIEPDAKPEQDMPEVESEPPQQTAPAQPDQPAATQPKFKAGRK